MSSALHQTSQIEPARAGGPIQWVNIAKGLGIILVVFGHVGRGVIEVDTETAKQGIAASASAVGHYVSIDNAIYAFHMALFFFLSGLFVERGAQKSSVTFFGQKLRTIVYPYFLWAILQCLFVAVAGGHAGSHVSPLEVIRKLPWEPYIGSQFWFLYVLMVCMTLYWALYQLRIGRTAITLIALAAYLLGQWVHASSHGQVLAWLSDWTVLYQTRMYFFYFAAGASLAPFLLRPKNQMSPILMLLTGAALLAGEYWLAKDFNPSHLPAHLSSIGHFAMSHGLNARDWVAMIPAFMGISGTIFLALFIDRLRIGKFLEWLGELTLPIYVAQVIAAAAARVALQKVLHVHQLGVHLIVGTVVGVAVPVVLEALSRGVGFNYLFAFGSASSNAKNRSK